MTDDAGHGAGRLRMKDLAVRLGISAATVSLALRESPRISAQTRERVRAAAAEMGYVYHRGAANLRTRRSRIIGVVVPDFRNPAFVKVLRAVSRRLNEEGRMFFLCDTGDSLERQVFFQQALSEYGADGMLVCPAPGTLSSALAKPGSGGLPTVCFARRLPEPDLDSVTSDDFEGLRMATRHLVALGHRRIAFVGGHAETSTAQDRRAGYLAGLADAGLPSDPGLLVSASTDHAGGFNAAAEVLALRPAATAALCFGDVIALGLMLGLRSAGVEPGRDFAVVGCDGIEEGELWEPRLTTVANRSEETGELAVDLLLRRIDEPARAVERIVLPPNLRIRTSCGAVPG